ncbi:hypothetical protein [Acinetobacter higginsii]|uniref:hypothetical protein n=1 Tax=Acinetobacter higginsii TaxID=70347 RepID=UPI001F4BAA62|nr:hypothetical protein [Acinetobacter higginsii]MCH7380390.1 hypothetical protein [Acinetobacter higginsii]
MKKLLIGLGIVFISNMSFAQQTPKNTILTFVYFNDFKTWLTGGKSLYDWSNFVDKDKTISKQAFEPHIIYHEFDSNVFAASKKFNTVPTLLNGVVYSVKSDNSNNPVVTFSAGYSDYFHAKGFTVDEVSKLKRGNQFKFICYKFDYDGYTLRSNQCTTISTYYSLLAPSLFKDIDLDQFEQNSPYKVKEVILKNISKVDLSKFDVECGVKEINDSQCMEKAEVLLSKLKQGNDK